MEAEVYMKAVTGEWFPTTLKLDAVNREMIWIKQDGKTPGQYGISLPIEAQTRFGQSRKFCFEVLHPTTKRSFIFAAAGETAQQEWIAAFQQVLHPPLLPTTTAAVEQQKPQVVAIKPVQVVAVATPPPPTVQAPKIPPLSDVPPTRTAASSSVSDTPTSSSLQSKKSSLFEGNAPASGSRCVVCNTPVYKMEEVIVDRMMMHKQCFQCEHCKRQLTMGNFACINGSMFYCKPHYFELFSTNGGKYEKAFGDAGFEKKALNSYTPGS